MIKINKIIILVLIFLSFRIAGAATPAGTSIVANEIRVDFQDKTKLFYLPSTVNVQAIYGFEIKPSNTRTVTINNLLPVYLAHSIKNNSNTTDNLNIVILNLNAYWQGQIINDNNRDGIHQSDENTIISAPLEVTKASTVNLFLALSHSNISTLNTGLAVSTNQAAVNYLGFNNLHYGGYGWQKVSDNIHTGPPQATLLLEALLQGYYNIQTDRMITANILVELRTTRNIPAPVSYNIILYPNGRTDLLSCYEPAGNYYVFVRHFNHIKVITRDKVNFSSYITTVNITSATSPYYRPVYLSSRAQNVTQALRTESNGRLTIRGGDYNNDNTINIVDWAAFDYEWKNSGVIADFDGNGIIDTRDYGIWLSNNQDYLPIDE